MDMLQAGLYVLVSLICSVSAALIFARGPSYAEARFPQDIAHTVHRGHSTYNGCRVSPCQIAYLNSVEDFCLWAPSRPALSAMGDTGHTFVAWCMKSAYGTRTIPDGTILGARLVITPEYLQITGVGNLTNINIRADGVASSSGEGDRAHGLVFTRAYGQLEQIHDWTSYVSQERFCFRACNPSAAASTPCPPIHDVSGCAETVPGGYDTGVFEDCVGDTIGAPSAWYQEALAAPLHQTSCTARATIGSAQVTRARRAIGAIASTSGSTSSAPVTSFTRWHIPSQGHNTPLPTTTNTATTITFPSSPSSTSTATPSMNFSTPALSATPTSTLYSYNHSHTHWHSHHHTSSPSSVSSSFNFSQSSSTASSLSDPSPTLLTSLTPSFTPTNSTSDPSSPSTSTFPSTSTPTSSFASSTSFSELSSPSSTPSSIAILTSSPTSSPSPSTLPSTSSPSQVAATPATSPSSSVPTTSPATSSPTFPNSQTQLGSQCPPPSQLAVNGGSIAPSAPLLPLLFSILTIILSTFAGLLVL